MTSGLALSAAVWALVAMFPAAMSPADGWQNAGRVAGEGQKMTAARPALEDDVVAGCLACHRDNLSLAEKEAERLAQTIAAMTRNEISHVVPIAALSEEDLVALAKALADPEPAQTR